MRSNVQYDIVLEMDYPLGSSTGLAVDTWAKEMCRRAGADVRMVRDGPHVSLCRRVWVLHKWDLANAINALLLSVHPQAPGDVQITLHEVPGTERRKEMSTTIPIEEELDDAQ